VIAAALCASSEGDDNWIVGVLLCASRGDNSGTDKLSNSAMAESVTGRLSNQEFSFQVVPVLSLSNNHSLTLLTRFLRAARFL